MQQRKSWKNLLFSSYDKNLLLMFEIFLT